MSSFWDLLLNVLNVHVSLLRKPRDTYLNLYKSISIYVNSAFFPPDFPGPSEGFVWQSCRQDFTSESAWVSSSL